MGAQSSILKHVKHYNPSILDTTKGADRTVQMCLKCLHVATQVFS